MARVKVDHIWCTEETDEIGSDDVYLVTFRGNTSGGFFSTVLSHGPGDFWDDFDTDEERSRDIDITAFRTDAVYVVMLVERDNRKDISGDVLSFWRGQLNAAWFVGMISLHASNNIPMSTPLPEAQRVAAARGIIDFMKGLAGYSMSFPLGNDERLGSPKRLVIAQGQKPLLEFKGDGGHYKVRFKVTA